MVQLVPILGWRKDEIVHVGSSLPNAAQDLRSLIGSEIVDFESVCEIEGDHSSTSVRKLSLQNLLDLSDPRFLSRFHFLSMFDLFGALTPSRKDYTDMLPEDRPKVLVECFQE